MEKIEEIIIEVILELSGYVGDNQYFGEKNEGLRIINYQFIVKCECQSSSMAGFQGAEKAVDQIKDPEKV